LEVGFSIDKSEYLVRGRQVGDERTFGGQGDTVYAKGGTNGLRVNKIFDGATPLKLSTEPQAEKGDSV